MRHKPHHVNRKSPTDFKYLHRFLWRKDQICVYLESVGLYAIRLSARANLACYLTFILCVVHCGVCPEDDPIPSAQLGYRVLPVEYVLLGE